MKKEGLLKVVKMRASPDPLEFPRRANECAAGYDLPMNYAGDVHVLPGCPPQMFHTGYAVVIPKGYFGMLRQRSSAFKAGLLVQGTVDSDYRGELRVLAINLTNKPIVVKAGDIIAQMILVKHADYPVCESGHLPATGRGSGGFGSTGNSIKS